MRNPGVQMQAQGFLRCDSAPAHTAHWLQAAPLTSLRTQMSYPSRGVGSQIRHFPFPSACHPEPWWTAERQGLGDRSLGESGEGAWDTRQGWEVIWWELGG